MNCNSKQNWP